ncbi:hypothetical protein GDO86_016977 [Hymenochirus boettgeri]|uniref:LRRCT domain-containing protein n=1 Tax=Hymenochirus boettgeri TaxID=247094 RepID=A0A8T2IL55_9PIPI|nr:hypothetical protein GDO86_016977 [Hymenochirus boettgeri]
MHLCIFKQKFYIIISKLELYFYLPPSPSFFYFLFLLSTKQLSSFSLCPSYCLCDSKFFFVNCSSLNLSSVLVFPPLSTEYLDLSGCFLQSLPSLENLWRLNTLLLSHNQIPDIDATSWSGMQSLQILDLRTNRISELSATFSFGLDSLIQLLLANNFLSTIPEKCFEYLHKLEFLDLQGNMISRLQSRALRPLTNLRRLQLQNNLLRSLQNNDFSALQRLEFLDLSGNQIQDLPPAVFSSLHSLIFLNLQQNHLRHLRFPTLRNLPAPGTVLLLSNNPWECDCDLQRVFGKLGGVHRLSLQDGEELHCAAPPPLKGRPLTSLDTRLCVAETVTVLVITLTVIVTVIGAIVTAERSRKRSYRTYEHEICVQD